MNHGLTDDKLLMLAKILAPYASELSQVGLFGSRAMGNYHPASDIDLVLYGSLAEEKIARINSLLQESTLPETVDVVAYERITEPLLKEHIDAVMLPLFSGMELGKLNS